MNQGWQYKLAGPQLSPHSSLVFNAQYFSRLQFSLGFNFLMTVHLSQSDKTAFSGLLQNITIVPLFGTSFTVYSPVIMILVALTTFVNLYSRALRLFGFDHEDAIISSTAWYNMYFYFIVFFENENHGSSLTGVGDVGS
jgi:hypothetical protein